ncbi:MAG: methionine--tRNA ligase [Alphaproteobacteria bacterium]
MPNQPKNNFYVTSPIYYVNDIPHIGHAYTSVACDVIARFKRLCDYEVKFLTGTDEHGQKVEKAANARSLTPQAFTDELSEHFKSLTKLLNLSNDDFIRTTEERHKQAAQSLWNKLLANGQIYLGSYAGWYSVRDEAFYNENELVNGIAPTGAPVEWVEESSYFFKLSDWGDKLLEFYEKNPSFIKPDYRKNEVINFVKSGLKDLSISRTSFKWGIPIEQNEDHIMYVWLDALTNYISAIDYPNTESENFKKFWPADFHIVGKDILRFHAIYWPAFLMAADLTPPKVVFAHGWWTNEGQKISKSLGNTIDPVKLIEEFGLDQVRYFLMREIPFGNDGNYSRNSMINRINSELSNNIGNLAQRTLSMIFKNCEGKIPELNVSISDLYNDIDLLKELKSKIEKYSNYMEKLDFSLALEVIMSIATEANIFIDQQAPWTLAKTDKDSMSKVLYILAETIRNIAICLQPFMPNAADKMLDQLLIEKNERSFEHLTSKYALKHGSIIEAPKAIFPRFENAS